MYSTFVIESKGRFHHRIYYQIGAKTVTPSPHAVPRTVTPNHIICVWLIERKTVHERLVLPFLKFLPGAISAVIFGAETPPGVLAYSRQTTEITTRGSVIYNNDTRACAL